MKIGKYEIILRRTRRYYKPIPSKSALIKWIKKNIKFEKTTRIVIEPHQIEVEEAYF